MKASTIATFALGLLLLTAVLPGAPLASAEMSGPTLSGAPVIDGSVEEAEWGVAQTYTFNSPRDGTSTIRIGYLSATGQLALGMVLADSTARESGDDDETDKVEFLLSAEAPESSTDSSDYKFVVYRDGSWQIHKGSTNASIGFNTAKWRSGSKPSSTDTSLWTLATARSAASWEVEMLVEIGSFEAGDAIATAIRQTDVDENDEVKTSGRPTNLDETNPSKWERTVLSGRPTLVQFSVSPTNMEAGVGGDIIVKLPADASGGRLTVQVKEPGQSGFIPIGTIQSANGGANRFHFAPLSTGNWQVQAVWAGDGKYGSITTKPTGITVARPSPDGVTVMETGSLRSAFSQDDAGSPAQWSYLNTHVDAQDADGDTLDLVRLDGKNSCRKQPWVGLANMGDGPLELSFDPPVLRAALALTSPEKGFEANIQAYTSEGQLKTEMNGAGSCGQPLFASLGDTKDDVERIIIDYSGEDQREVIDVLFAHPLASTDPQTVVRTDPSPLHPGGVATVHASGGSPYRLNKVTVSAYSGSTKLASSTCEAQRSDGDVWIDCPLEVEVPSSAKKVKVLVKTEDRFGTVYPLRTHWLDVETDTIPPLGSVLPRPLMAGQGAAVAVTAEARDASGIERIDLNATDQDGNTLNEKRCPTTGLQLSHECVMGVTPPANGFAFVTATFEDGAGNVRTVGPKPLPVRGPDQDGDGLPDRLEEHIGTSVAMPDTDMDGLHDGWEVVGVDRNGDGTAELDLPALGADPLVRDLFMEVDWTEGHAIHKNAIYMVRNLLTSHGIRLHVDAYQAGGPFDATRYDHGHAAHRALMDPARAGIVMHVLAGEMGGPAAGGGSTIYLPVEETSEQSPSIVGAQLLRQIGRQLELGPGGGETTDKGRVVYTEDYKPNYLSIMNNAYAWGVYVDTVNGMVRVPTLSGIAMGTIDEKALNEPEGLDMDLPAFYESLRAGPTHVLEDQSLTGLMIRYTCPGEGLVRWASPIGSVDWNCDGTSSNIGVSVDVNVGGQNKGTTELNSRTDWDALSFRGPSCPHYGLAVEDQADHPASTTDHALSYEPLGLAPCPLHAEPTLEPDAHIPTVPFAEAPSGAFEDADGQDNDLDGETDEGFADDDQDGWPNLIDACPLAIDVPQDDKDHDLRGDACQDRPGALQDLSATHNTTLVETRLSWGEADGVWGYNVYLLSGGNVTRMGETFPTTTQATYVHAGAPSGARYMVVAVGELGDQGPGEPITPQVSGGGTAGGGNDDGGNGTGGQQGVPGPGAVVAALVASLLAAGLRRRR